MAAGLTRHIGVSNFSVKKLSELLPHCSIKPEINQVEIVWHLRCGVSTIPKSVTPARLRENPQQPSSSSPRADIDRIAGLDRSYRLIAGEFWVFEGSPWTLQTIWDD